MKSKVALVVGAAGGIGSAIVDRLEKEGMTVCRVDKVVPNKKSGEKFYELDVRDELAVAGTIGKILIRYGEIDVVVMAATISYEHKNLLKLAWRDVEAHIEVQTKGLLLVTQALREQIEAKRRTKFIIILSEYCLGKPPAGFADYGVAKYSVLGLARAMLAELSTLGSTINMISPGLVNTPLIKSLPSKLVKMAAEQNPMKRVGRPQDVAGVVAFLVSDEADYLNGVNILVNGGNILA